MLFNYYKKNKRAIIFLFLFVFAASFYGNLNFFVQDNGKKIFCPPFVEWHWNLNDDLGAEYFHIAQSIVLGDGFSNPFLMMRTGPTSWCAPVYPFILALLIKLFKTRTMVMIMILILKNLVLLLTGLLVYETAKKTFLYIKPYFVLIVYAVWLTTFFVWFFQFTHDPWLVLAAIDLIYLLTLKILSNPNRTKLFIVWGIVGGLATLTNPILGAMWLAVLIATLSKVNKKKMMISIVMFMAVTSGWIARNFIVFNEFIFVKSNLYYEAYQANYDDGDGVFDEIYFIDHHPCWSRRRGERRTEYERLGEKEFSALYKKKFWDTFKDDPYTYFRKVKNRFFSALLVCPRYFHQDGLERFYPWRAIVHAWPFFSLLFIVLFRKDKDRHILLAIFMYSIFLAVYIIISYYIRYSLPLIPFQVLFIGWGADLLYGKLFKKKRSLRA